MNNSVVISLFQTSWLEFVYAMTTKEVKARYRHAALGFLWVVINPLMQMIVIGFIFQFFVPVKVENYFVFLFAGLLPWMFFNLSLSKAVPSIVYERMLIQKAKFSQEAIPLSIVFSNLFHFIVALVLLIVYLFIDNFIRLQTIPIEFLVRQLFLIPILIWICLLVCGLSLLLSALNVKFRDVNFIVQAGLTFWFYGTPIIYTLDLIPENFVTLFYLNPMTSIIEAFRWVLLEIPPLDWKFSILSFGFSLVIFLWSFNFFSNESKTFSDWL